MKHLVILFCWFSFSWGSLAQTSKAITLEECYVSAQEHYPLIKQRELIAKSKEYSMDNVSRANLPQVVLYGQATYQSDVTQIPISLPNVDIPTLSKDQYRLYGEVVQSLTDFMTIRQQKLSKEINSSIQEQNLEVELYKLKDRINQLFFGALLIWDQLRQNEMLKNDIQITIKKVDAAVDHGTELKSNLNKLKAELLKANQRTIELQGSRKAFLDMLGLFINRTLTDSTTLARPEMISIRETVVRPELKLYDFQKRSYEVQTKLINTRNNPNLGLFLQGGFGRPSPVNMLSNEFSTYYIGGVRLNWMLSSFYTSAKEKQLLVINQNMVETQKETFLFNINISIKQHLADLARLQNLIKTDEDIISLRTSVKQASSIQLENGVITLNDYLKEVSAEDQARQNKILHETQMLMALYSYQNTFGNR